MSSNRGHQALDHTKRFRWEDGWVEMVHGKRVPEEVPECDPQATRTRQKLNARRRAEQRRAAMPSLPERQGEISSKSVERAPRSRYLGVSYRTTTGRWEAHITPDHAAQRVRVGDYATEEEAARERDNAVLRWDIPAPLNFMIGEDQ